MTSFDYPAALDDIVASQPYPLLFAVLSGAHMYGFASPDSDFDVRGVHILPLPDVLRLNDGQERVGVMRDEQGLELDLTTHDIKPYFERLLNKNGNMLEQIYSPHVLHTTPYHEELKAIAKDCVTRFYAYHYLGFSARKWEEFAAQPADAKQVKTLLYVYRVLFTGLHLMRTGDPVADLNELNQVFQQSFVDDLIAFKQETGETATLNDVDVAFHRREYERLHEELDAAKDNTHLPENPSGVAALDDLLVRVRLRGWQEMA